MEWEQWKIMTASLAMGAVGIKVIERAIANLGRKPPEHPIEPGERMTLSLQLADIHSHVLQHTETVNRRLDEAANDRKSWMGTQDERISKLERAVRRLLLRSRITDTDL